MVWHVPVIRAKLLAQDEPYWAWCIKEKEHAAEKWHPRTPFEILLRIPHTFFRYQPATPHLIASIMKFFTAITTFVFAATAALAAPSASMTVTVSYDQTYDNAALSLNEVACSDGPNGLEPGKYPTHRHRAFLTLSLLQSSRPSALCRPSSLEVLKPSPALALPNAAPGGS